MATSIPRANIQVLRSIGIYLDGEGDADGRDEIEAAIAEIETLRSIAANRAVKREREKQTAQRVGRKKGRLA